MTLGNESLVNRAIGMLQVLAEYTEEGMTSATLVKAIELLEKAVGECSNVKQD